MTDYQKSTIGFYTSSSQAYKGINISNHDYAKYSRSSLNSYVGFSQVTPERTGSSSKNVTKNNSVNNNLVTDMAFVQSSRESSPPVDLSSSQITTASSSSNKTITKRYQKYRSLLLSRKSSSASLKQKSQKSNIALTDLPDDVIQLIFNYVSSDVTYLDISTYNSDTFFGSASEQESLSGKRSYSVSFNLTPILDNDSSSVKINSNYQQKIKRPKENAGEKQFEKYVNQVLSNYKLSKHYKSSPNRHIISLLYVNKRLYRLALPYVYRNIKFHSTYRLAQFITSIRANNNLGLLVESIDLYNIDILYYLSYDISNKDSSLILTEGEKNKIEHLMNDQNLYFDGTFDFLDMKQIPSSRVNINEIMNVPGRFPILIVADEHSMVSNNNISMLESVECGYKKKVILAGWREWKFRDDPLYTSTVPTIEWLATQTSKTPNVRKSISIGTLGTLETSERVSRSRSNSVGRISSRTSDFSLSSSSLELVGGSLRLKFRKIVSRFSGKTDHTVKKNTKANKSIKTTINSKNFRGSRSNTVSSSNLEMSTVSIRPQLQFYRHPIKCKLLAKYSSKDIPIGFITHLLQICQNLRDYDMSKAILTSDYIIKYDAVDDYGVLQTKMKGKAKKSESRRGSFDISYSRSANLNDHLRSFNDSQGPYHTRSKSVSELLAPRSFSNGSSSSIDSPIKRSSSHSRVVDNDLTPVGSHRNDTSPYRSESISASSPYDTIRKEIDNAYGVSIYSQFSSVIAKKPSSPYGDFFESTVDDHDSSDSKALDFYKDSFGYSGSCNYKQIQTRFYKEFWGITPGTSNSNFTYTLAQKADKERNGVLPRVPGSLISRSKSPSIEFRPLLERQSSVPVRSLDPTGLGMREAGARSSLRTVVSSESAIEIEDGDDDPVEGKSKGKERQPVKPKPPVLSVNTANMKKLKPQINIIEEIEEDDQNKGGKSIEEDYLSNSFAKEQLRSTKSPTTKYFQFNHEPTVTSATHQNDSNLHLSDVRKINNWSIDQLSRISNKEIMNNLASLKNLESLVMKHSNWISTNDIEVFLTKSQAIRHRKLRSIDLRGSGMRRDLSWAIKGSVREVKKSLTRDDRDSSLIAAVGRNYISL